MGVPQERLKLFEPPKTGLGAESILLEFDVLSFSDISAALAKVEKRCRTRKLAPHYELIREFLNAIGYALRKFSENQEWVAVMGYLCADAGWITQKAPPVTTIYFHENRGVDPYLLVRREKGTLRYPEPLSPGPYGLVYLSTDPLDGQRTHLWEYKNGKGNLI
jgi:hypothetical protein